jgi:hypothetical protein
MRYRYRDVKNRQFIQLETRITAIRITPAICTLPVKTAALRTM